MCLELMVEASRSLPVPQTRTKHALCRSLVELGCSKTRVVGRVSPSSRFCYADRARIGHPLLEGCICGRTCRRTGSRRTRSAGPMRRLARSGCAQRSVVRIGLAAKSTMYRINGLGRTHHSQLCISVQHCPCYPLRSMCRKVTTPGRISRSHCSNDTWSSLSNAPNLPCHRPRSSSLGGRKVAREGRFHRRPPMRAALLIRMSEAMIDVYRKPSLPLGHHLTTLTACVCFFKVER